VNHCRLEVAAELQHSRGGSVSARAKLSRRFVCVFIAIAKKGGQGVSREAKGEQIK